MFHSLSRMIDGLAGYLLTKTALARWNIRKTLMWGFGLMVAFVVVQSVISYFALSYISASSKKSSELVGGLHEGFEHLFEVSESTKQAAITVGSNLDNKVDPGIQELSTSIKFALSSLESRIGEIDSISATAEEISSSIEQFSEIVEANEKLSDVQFAIEDLIFSMDDVKDNFQKELIPFLTDNMSKASLISKDIQALRSNLDDMSAKMDEAIEEEHILDNKSIEAKEISEGTTRLAQYQSFVITAIGILSLAFCLIIPVILIRRISEPLAKLKEYLGLVSSGTLNKTIDYDVDDEIGELAIELNQTVKRIREMLGNISDCANRLDSSSTGIDSRSGEVKQGSARISEESVAIEQTVSSIGDAMRASMEQVSELEQVSANISSKASQSSHAAEEVSRALNTSLEKVEALRSLASNIETIVKTIKYLSDQTKILAFNASIEAARASEHGKGFAVVANEVKHLSQETESSSDQIFQIIEQLLHSVQEVAHGFTDVQNEITKSAESIHSIIEETNKQLEANSLVSNQSEMVFGQSQDLTDQMKGIRDVVEANQQVAIQVADEGKRLLELSHNLKQLVGQFQV